MTPLNVSFFPIGSGGELCHFSRDPSISIQSGTYKECQRGSIYGSEGQFRRVAITFIHTLAHNNEIEILSKLSTFEDRSEHIVTALGYTPDSIIFEECGSDLSVLQQTNPNALSLNIWNIIEGVLKAVAYLHGKNLVHRDVTINNVLVTLSKNGKAHTVLADLAETMDYSDTQALKIVGTVSYMAPEVILALSQKQTFMPVGTNLKALDVFATGILIWELSQFKPLEPFLFNPPTGFKLNEAISTELAGEFKVHYEKMKDYFLDDDAYNFLNMLNFSPDTRPSAQFALTQLQGH